MIPTFFSREPTGLGGSLAASLKVLHIAAAREVGVGPVRPILPDEDTAFPTCRPRKACNRVVRTYVEGFSRLPPIGPHNPDCAISIFSRVCFKREKRAVRRKGLASRIVPNRMGWLAGNGKDPNASAMEGTLRGCDPHRPGICTNSSTPQTLITNH